MSDLIRREDALECFTGAYHMDAMINAIDAIRALPAVRPVAGGGDIYEDEAVERAVGNILTNPSLTLDSDQMREDREERARLAREDDQ